MTPLRALILLRLVFLAAAFEGITFSHTFTLPNAAYKQAVRAIHSPEYLSCRKPIVVPGFDVLESFEPVVVRNYTMIEFTFRTILGEGHARMMTDRASRSHVVLSQLNRAGIPDTPVCCMSLDVAREGVRGHSMKLRGQTFGETPVWVRVIMGMALQSSVWIQVMRWGYAMHDKNLDLEAYRCDVLAKDGVEL